MAIIAECKKVFLLAEGDSAANKGFWKRLFQRNKPTVEPKRKIPPVLYLLAKIPGEQIRISIADFFKEKYKAPGARRVNLTNKRIKAIQDTMPELIEVTKYVGKKGYSFEISPDDLERWWDRIRQLNNTIKRG